jgi:hypothetical protein
LRVSAKVPQDETIVALIDTSSFSWEKSGVLVGFRAMYCREAGFPRTRLDYGSLRDEGPVIQGGLERRLRVGDVTMDYGFFVKRRAFEAALSSLRDALRSSLSGQV